MDVFDQTLDSKPLSQVRDSSGDRMFHFMDASGALDLSNKTTSTENENSLKLEAGDDHKVEELNRQTWTGISSVEASSPLGSTPKRYSLNDAPVKNFDLGPWKCFPLVPTPEQLQAQLSGRAAVADYQVTLNYVNQLFSQLMKQHTGQNDSCSTLAAGNMNVDAPAPTNGAMAFPPLFSFLTTDTTQSHQKSDLPLPWSNSFIHQATSNEIVNTYPPFYDYQHAQESTRSKPTSESGYHSSVRHSSSPPSDPVASPNICTTEKHRQYRKARAYFQPKHMQCLEDFFRRSPYLSTKDRELLSQKLQLSEDRVSQSES
ncbi:homeobox protein [Clonorchis sinensis]|uniref:Homeobox protein n=1 Tax=Clonorchis sinensis TaxID=79923 RepID=G7YUA8_CLOSI|nr:homeobox protein [Clonorchis sinensis]